MDSLAAALACPSAQALTTRVVEALLNNESSFFRDFSAFEAFDRGALETMRTRREGVRRLRIWSAGCSTGQEPYTLAMLIADAESRWKGWTIEIVATDVSASAVSRARAGRFTQFEIQRGLPVRTMLHWFDQRDDEWHVDPRLKKMIRFGVHNLLDPPPGRFDVILCRNVLMYFAPSVKARVFDRLSSALESDGILMLGAGETVIGQTERFVPHPVHRGLYAARCNQAGARGLAAA